MEYKLPFTLERPLTWVDLETTGTDPREARIVQIGIIQLRPDAEPVEYATLVNPTIPIPPAATEKHKITDAMVADAPTFKTLAPRLVNAFTDVDLGGFNAARYDVEVLKAEFARAGVSTELKPGVKPPRMIDGFRLWQVTNPRTLTDYVREMLDEDHAQAHDAVADIRGTLRAVLAHLKRDAAKLPATLDGLHEVQFPRNPNALDADGKIAWFEGDGGTRFAALTLGKHAGVPLSKVPRSYLEWALSPRGWTDLKPDAHTILIQAKHGTFPVPAKSGNATTGADTETRTPF